MHPHSQHAPLCSLLSSVISALYPVPGSRLSNVCAAIFDLVCAGLLCCNSKSGHPVCAGLLCCNSKIRHPRRSLIVCATCLLHQACLAATRPRSRGVSLGKSHLWDIINANGRSDVKSLPCFPHPSWHSNSLVFIDGLLVPSSPVYIQSLFPSCKMLISPSCCTL